MQKTLINGFKDLKNIVPSDKKLILFMTGATPLDERDTIQKAFDTNLKKDEKNILHTGNHSIFDTDSKL